MNTSLADLLKKIEVPHSTENDSRYTVTPILELGAHYFGRTGDGVPCLLINSKAGGVKPPLRLAGVEAYFALQCNILLADGTEKVETLTVITCTAKEQSLQTYFIYICEMLLKIIGPTPTLRQVVDAVWRLVELFQKLARPSSNSVIGLWGELYTIHRSPKPHLAVQAWRSEVDDRFDFSVDNLRLEVKSTSMPGRIHEFSFEQCNPPDETTGVLVSLMVETSGNGTSLQELIERITTQIGGDAELTLKLQNNVAETLGESLPRSLNIRFDEYSAKDSLLLFDLREIPAIREKLPDNVSQVRFRSDLSRISPKTAKAFTALGKYERGLLPS